MFNIVLEKSNVVGVWYTYDQIILTGMDWFLCAFHNFSDHLFLIIRGPGYWYQQPLSDYKKCQIAVCSSVAYGTHWDPQWQPDTTGVVITPLQQIHIDNRGQPACRSLMGLGWGCPIDCLGNSTTYWGQGPLLLIGFDFNPSMDKHSHALLSVRWSYLSIHTL